VRTLTTERLTLVPLDLDRDAEGLHTMLGDPRMYEFSEGGPTRDVTESRARLADELAGNGGRTWTIMLPTERAPIGTIGVFYDQGTPIRGLDWKLHADYWGRGFMGEAAPAVVDHLLSQPDIDGVEAWIDSRNTRSLGVARRARLDERARLPRVYADRQAQQIVMARAAAPRDPDVLTVRTVLPVKDIRATRDLLTSVLGLSVAFEHGEPPTFLRLRVGPWSGCPGIDLAKADGNIAPVQVLVEMGISTDEVYERAVAAGVKVLGSPVDEPWYRREFQFRLAEGHEVRVAGPLRPERPGSHP
jgi:RimJ/RimL family protein N-acetyltransferase/catechol 2,3-dioxygenase-like lactoylglutathione lyase family enzyme